MVQLDSFRTGKFNIPIFYMHTLVIGSGAASLSCADRLHQFGIKDVVLVTEGLKFGTSRNTGSDKQTYYKLSDMNNTPDSSHMMALSLFNGGSMHGDIALVEASCSLQAFYHLVNIGVEFPHNEYGTFVGYKTDYDEKQRGTSIGPYTSREMVKALLSEVKRRGIIIHDNTDVVKLLKVGQRVVGAVCIDKQNIENNNYGLVCFLADNIVFGVGGPGGLYADSVYPHGHTGAIGLALEIGAEASNLTESQFGLASIRHRWNVSGTFQQVIPRYISTDQNGEDETEFLNDWFPSIESLTHAVFLKGYQWPFDPGKVENYGSSLIDILVYKEIHEKGRRVFLDFRRNPEGNIVIGRFNLDKLSCEARDYLKKSNALFGLPIDRLMKMNPDAVKMYKSHGIDLFKESLEIAVCSQHNNGGLSGDIWWESTNLQHFFPIGEVNGSHGVYRPGGSALNSGQVGALRAAQKISAVYRESTLDIGLTLHDIRPLLKEFTAFILEIIVSSSKRSQYRKPLDYRHEFQTRMSKVGGYIREERSSRQGVIDAQKQFEDFNKWVVNNRHLLPFILKNRHLVLAHWVYLSAINFFIKTGGGSRGSYIILDEKGKKVESPADLGIVYRESSEDGFEKILISRFDESGEISHRFIKRKSIPNKEYWFESVWEQNRNNTIFRMT